ncbi:hypothetical protein [Chitinophaga ginsengisoli]|uniref:Uncharacterized protein n=1 Tax=Chitinophaga ginsengisoli TaxID=363837 RepID=A0A2P8GKY9_9BACT|nr:hypothetical protein [Chitinophaga ginsengisoli]PSL34638.1 hypothetical protein CLV42_102211 [Chitinophaga ginsengisoli]
MAINKNNFFLEGISGTIAKSITLRQYRGKTIVSEKSKGSTLPPTAEQIAVRERFEDAADFAVEVLNDPMKKAAYNEAAIKLGMSAYALALKDAHSFPEIRRIVTTKYKGLVGDTITIKAKDVFTLDNVKVEIRSAANALIEEGEALVAGGNSKYWIFTATVANPAVAGTRVKVIATDMPGNQTMREFTIS